MESALKSLKQLQGIARCSEAGEVIEHAGTLDADTLAAVAAVCAPPLREVGDLLAAGRLERWYLVTEQSTYYGSERATERLLAVGEPVKNPEASSKQLHATK
jgi:hypothetical protein